MADELKVRLVHQVCDVLFAAGEEIIKADDLLGGGGGEFEKERSE